MNYELSSESSRPKEVVQDERTVHNELYTASDVHATTSLSTSGHGQLQPPPSTNVYDYASVSVADTSQVPQHTLLHSTMSTSDDTASHAYSKPTTPVTNYDRTVNHFQVGAQVHSPVDAGQDSKHNYSTLNGALIEPHLEQSQGHSHAGNIYSEYSHINDEHKYSKLSDPNSKGYSQLDVRHTHTTAPALVAEPHTEGQAFPYEVPFSPSANSTGEEDNAYSTLEPPEIGDAGYSKLHVVV